VKKKYAFMSALCLSAIAGIATAQVATPPPKAKAPTPEFKAPASKPVAPEQANPQPRTVKPDITDPKVTRGTVPPMPYKKLAQFDSEGKVIRFDIPLDIEALRNNPLVGDSKVPEMMPMLIGRRYRMETIVIENLDFVEQVDSGLLRDMTLTDTDEMKKITDIITPLVPPKSITQEMFDRQLLSPVQQRFNTKILGEYQTDMMAEFTQADANTGLTEFMKYIMGESVKESMLAFDGLLAESTWRMKGVLAKAGLEGTPQAADLLAIQGSPNDADETQNEHAQAVRKAWATWDLGQKQAFLKAVQETRADSHQPPVKVVDISNPDIEDQTGTRTIGVTRTGSPVPPSKKKEKPGG
jgi:hypothetical protein